jgi:nitrite reductase/ring-hydroxylating ferredoxin subunit
VPECGFATHAVELGRAVDFTRLPARVEASGAAYYLTRDGGRWRLLSAVCPHLGGDVEDRGDVFRCPNHSWMFVRSTGTPVNFALRGMSGYDVEERDGVLVAHVETAGQDGVRAWQRAQEAAARRRPAQR